MCQSDGDSILVKEVKIHISKEPTNSSLTLFDGDVVGLLVGNEVGCDVNAVNGGMGGIVVGCVFIL